MPITLGYIATPAGNAALKAASEEAIRRNSRVVVVNVTHPAEQGSEPFSEEQELDAVQRHLEGAGIETEVRQVPFGDEPADVILATAAETGSELIIIGLRHRSAVSKLILGSTAQRVLLGADCAVQVVKAVSSTHPRNG
jgi:nucleotide-binding universal stress UspA family protein